MDKKCRHINNQGNLAAYSYSEDDYHCWQCDTKGPSIRQDLLTAYMTGATKGWSKVALEKIEIMYKKYLWLKMEGENV